MNRFIHLFFLGFLAITSVFASDAFTKEGDVIVLTTENFNDALQEFDTLLVEFYAPWCGHCKSLEPEYAKAATILLKNDPPIYIAKVDTTQHRELSEEFEIRGYPTLKLFKNGRISDYDSGRTANDIVSFMKQKSGPVVHDLSSVADYQDFSVQHKIIAVALLNDKSSNFYKMFEDVAFSIDLAKFAYSSNAEVKKHFGVDENAEAVVVMKRVEGEQSQMALTEETTDADISSFISGSIIPLIVEFSQQTAKQIFSGPMKSHLLVFVNKEDEYYNDLEGVITSVAREFKGKLLHVIVPSSESRIMDFFGFKAEDLPAAIISDMRTETLKKYLFESEFTIENLIKFETQFLNDELTISLKSEKASESDDAGNVKVIVGESFQEKVINNDKDVLLEFYAPWCGHCKSLAPVYEELGEKFSKIDNIVIAKIDATGNEIDHPKVNVRGFPTIIFFPGNDKDSPITFDGGRDLDGFVEFLRKHATNKFVLDGVEGGKDEL